MRKIKQMEVNANELLIGTMSNEVFQNLKVKHELIIPLQDLEKIFWENLYDKKEEHKQGLNMIELTRENGNQICQCITQQILKIIEDKDKINSTLYLDLYFFVLSLIWRCLPDFEPDNETS